jgi:hypothetical protein
LRSKLEPIETEALLKSDDIKSHTVDKSPQSSDCHVRAVVKFVLDTPSRIKFMVSAGKADAAESELQWLKTWLSENNILDSEKNLLEECESLVT